MEWTETAPQPTPVLHILDGSTSFYAVNTEELSLMQAMLDYDAQSENTSPRTAQVRVLTLGEAGQAESCSLPIPEEPDWNQGWPTSEMIPRFHVVDNSTSYNALNPQGLTLEQGAAHYGNAYLAGTEIFVCENREPHEITIREVSASLGNGPASPFTVPVAEE